MRASLEMVAQAPLNPRTHDVSHNIQSTMPVLFFFPPANWKGCCVRQMLTRCEWMMAIPNIASSKLLNHFICTKINSVSRT